MEVLDPHWPLRCDGHSVLVFFRFAQRSHGLKSVDSLQDPVGALCGISNVLNNGLQVKTFVLLSLVGLLFFVFFVVCLFVNFVMQGTA